MPSSSVIKPYRIEGNGFELILPCRSRKQAILKAIKLLGASTWSEGPKGIVYLAFEEDLGTWIPFTFQES